MSIVACLLGIGLVALMVGSPTLDPSGVIAAFGAPDDHLIHLAVVDLRLPRFLLAVVGGAGLGMAGALLQDGLRNPLAAPELLGVTGGAALVVAVVAVLQVPIPRTMLPLAATCGGLVVGSAVLLTGLRRRDSVAMILIGLACSSFLSGAVIVVVALGHPSDVGLFYSFLAGSLANRSWPDLRIVVPWVVVAVPVGLLLARRLNVLRLGDDTAATLGVGIRHTRHLVFGVSCVLSASVAAVCGPISFVALLAPHLARRALHTTDARVILPWAMATGALLLSSTDTIGRLITHPREIAAGVWTMLVGAPVLLFMLRTRLAHQRDPAR